MDRAKPQQTEQAGLQPASPHDAPEVVVHSSPRFQERPWSTESPEAVTPNEYSRYEKAGYEYYSGRPEGRSETHHGGHVENQSAEQKQEKRVCGLRRAVFLWVLAAIILLVVIAAVLGGALGTVLNDSGSDSSSSTEP